MTRDFTGAQIEAILEQQFVNPNGSARQLILAVSRGAALHLGQRRRRRRRPIDPANITIGGVALIRTATYTVAMNNFLGFGGDSFPAMLAGDNPQFGLDDLVALEAYLAIPATTRMTRRRQSSGASDSTSFRDLTRRRRLHQSPNAGPDGRPS